MTLEEMIAAYHDNYRWANLDEDRHENVEALIDALIKDRATATAAAEAARSQLAVAVEALETITQYKPFGDTGRAMQSVAEDALAKLRAAKEGR